MNYFEQSVFGEIEKDKLIPQFPGRAWANWYLILIFWAADLTQAHTAFLSAEVDAADARAEAPAQHAAGGFPEPLTR